MSDIDHRQLLINLCASMGLADHMGDVANDVRVILKKAGITPPADIDDLSSLMMWLGKEHGARSAYDTVIYDPKEDDCGVCGELKTICDASYDQVTYELVCEGAMDREPGEK